VEQTPSPRETWIPVDMTPEAMVLRAVVLVLIGLAALVIAKGLFEGSGYLLREWLPRRIRRGVAGPDPRPWETPFWLCGACLTSNLRKHAACQRCTALRAEVELHRTVETIADDIPSSITVASGTVVRLVHDPHAHIDPGLTHWKLVVGGIVAGSVGSASRVSALLAAVDGADLVLFDPLGTGHRSYRISDLAEAFSRQPIPLRTPCPERSLPAHGASAGA
jgi:hypothetical protein